MTIPERQFYVMLNDLTAQVGVVPISQMAAGASKMQKSRRQAIDGSEQTNKH
jgi:hypothetical protein